MVSCRDEMNTIEPRCSLAISRSTRRRVKNHGPRRTRPGRRSVRCGDPDVVDDELHGAVGGEEIVGQGGGVEASEVPHDGVAAKHGRRIAQGLLVAVNCHYERPAAHQAPRYRSPDSVGGSGDDGSASPQVCGEWPDSASFTPRYRRCGGPGRGCGERRRAGERIVITHEPPGGPVTAPSVLRGACLTAPISEHSGRRSPRSAQPSRIQATSARFRDIAPQTRQGCPRARRLRDLSPHEPSI